MQPRQYSPPHTSRRHKPDKRLEEHDSPPTTTDIHLVRPTQTMLTQILLCRHHATHLTLTTLKSAWIRRGSPVGDGIPPSGSLGRGIGLFLANPHLLHSTIIHPIIHLAVEYHVHALYTLNTKTQQSFKRYTTRRFATLIPNSQTHLPTCICHAAAVQQTPDALVTIKAFPKQGIQ